METVGLAPASYEQIVQSVPARRIVCRGRDLADVMPIICDGWAASTVTLSNGGRQILSFLLPGDLVSTALLFDASSQLVVEAITDVRYRTFDREELRTALFAQPSLLDTLSKAWIEEKTRSDQLIVGLGRRSADERIAQLILSLKGRLAKRGFVRGSTFEFPLRQHHIADAMGLTPVHVSKILSDFRRSGLIELSGRSLTVLDPVRFEQIATVR
jgi:CRP/FNR family transcriptional regulator, anaerobic regulatory protein